MIVGVMLDASLDKKIIKLQMELYGQIKINLSYDDHYVDDNDYSKLNELLMSWVKKEKPASYGLLNAQTLFIEEVKEGGGLIRYL
jgi:hypothetical protein